MQPRFAHIQSRAATLLSAGLGTDAVELLEEARAEALAPHELPELHLRRADALLAVGLAERSREESARARSAFRKQGRSWFELRARFAEVRAHDQVRGRGGASETREVATALHAESAREAPLALTLAGQKERGAERWALWQQAITYRVHPNGLVRASAYLAGAFAHQEADDRGGVLRACSAGLDAIDEHRRLMGSSELRALATTHGRELTEIALRHAAHDPRTLLRWSERTRATALAQPPATSDAATIPASLAALRDNGRRLAEARQAGEPTEELERERLRLERAVRTEHHTQSAEGDAYRPAPVEEIVAGVGDGCLVELVDVDGTLHVLVVHNGRVRRKVAGTTKEVADLLGPAAMLLRRASRGRPASTADIGRRLQDAILGDAAALIPDGPVTLAPTARLHGLAWSLLPTLHDRPFGIVPSAGQWLRAGAAVRPDPRRTTLVAGPDLESGGAEVPVLARQHPDAVLLDGPDATLANVLDALDGADLAHLATHGRFRADSPLFSALDLADGPLTVHDLERLRRAPYRVVLSACESGVLAPVGAQELLGLAAALFSIGTAGLVSSVAEVNDAATADLMIGLHDGLARGDDPATALLHVRRAAAQDPV
ncbi:CHAT domain-containing protein, partial [Nocardioides pelophilus]|uniref:CHAT domain-containing protein n=1 Tax=Nocardioides pelophilus TaxID=2172019 RepID=UPI00160350AA